MSHDFANKVISVLWTLFWCISLVLVFGYMTIIAIEQLPDPKHGVKYSVSQEK